MKTVKAFDANNKVLFTATARNDDEVDRLVATCFHIDGMFRIEVK